MFLLYIFIFLICCYLLYSSGNLIINSLMRIAKFLGWREFVIAFFIMAFAASLPNLFVGISSVIHKIPQLSLGDIIGGNVVDLTLSIALAVLFSKEGISAKSQTIQTTSVFTAVAALLPIILLLDNELSRIDSLLLIFVFIFYFFWLFSKKERFTKIYEKDNNIPHVLGFKIFLKDLWKIFCAIILLLLAAEGIVRSASFFAKSFNLSLPMIGILIVSIGNCLPEMYFAIASARKNETWMILGDLMGAVIVPTTLVLGFISLIHPIKIADFSPFVIARFFLIISVIFFFFFIKTDRKITKKEAIILLSFYFIFIAVEFLMK